MSAKKTAPKKKLSSKDAILQEITAQLSQALTTLKESLGEKKFDKRIKKAAKLLSEGVKAPAAKKTPAAKPAPVQPKPAKKAAVATVKKAAKKSVPAK